MILHPAAPSNPSPVLFDPEYKKGMSALCRPCSSSSMRKQEDDPGPLSMWEDSFHKDVDVDGDDGDVLDEDCSLFQPRRDDSFHSISEEEPSSPPPAAAAAAAAAAAQSPRSVLEDPGTETVLDAVHAQVRKYTTTHSIASHKKTGPLKKHISWGFVHVRRHAIMLGDHPDTASGGPPLSIEWTALSEFQLPLDEYEFERQPYRAHSRQELLLSAEFRYELLRRNGVTDMEILHSLWQSEHTQWQRCQTVRELAFFGWHEFIENLQRLFQLPQPALKTKY